MNADYETGVFIRDPDQLFDHSVQLENVIDLFPHDIRSRHIGIACNDAEAAQILRQIVTGGHLITDDGQRRAADAGQKAQQYSGFPRNIRHDFMDLPQLGRKLSFVEKRSIRNLSILNSVFSVFSRDPEQQILIERVLTKSNILAVMLNLGCIGAHFTVGNLINVKGGKLLFCRGTFRENIAVEIDFFQIGKDRLTIFRYRQGVSNSLNIGRGISGIPENEISEVDKGEIVDSPFPVFPGHGEIAKLLNGLFPRRFQTCVLFRRTPESKLLNIIIGIADLVHHAKCNQKLGRKISVHMSMQISVKLAFASDISLDQGLFDTKAIVLGLAHQGFGDGRDGSLEFNASVGEDVRHFCPAQAQDIHPAIVSVKIARNISPDHEQTGFLLRCPAIEEFGQVPDQIPRMVVRRPHNVVHTLAFHIEVDNDILLPIQIKLLKKYDGSSHPLYIF